MRRGVTGWFESMSARDAAYIYDEGPGHPEMIIACYLFDASGGAPVAASSATSLRRWVGERLGAADFLTRRIRHLPLEIGLPVWVPAPDLDLDRHVHLHAIDGGEPELRAMLSEFAATRVDLGGPPWQIHALVGLRDVDGLDEAVAVVVKIHHCAADGMAVRTLEAALFSESSLPDPPARIRPAHPLETTVRGVVGAPWRLARFIHRVRSTRADAEDVARRTREGLLPAGEAARPTTRFNAPSSGSLHLELRTFDHADIRAARRAVPGATVNDVLLAAVSGALRRQLAELDESPEGSLAAMVPISLRLPDGRTGASRADRTGGGAANQLLLGTIDLHSDVPDPVERLAAISMSAADEKARWIDDRVRRAYTRIDASPSWLLALRGVVRRRTRTGGVAPHTRLRNTMISNLPAPAGAPTFDGAPMRTSFGVLPVVDGDLLRHLFATLGNRLILSVTVDPEVMADPAHYADLIADELFVLATASGPV